MVGAGRAERQSMSRISIETDTWIFVVQVYEGGKGLAFHFDKDEELYKNDEVMKHPHLSSVLYLPGTDEDRLRQADVSSTPKITKRGTS